MTEPIVLSVTVCLFTDAQLLDYGGPLDLLGFLNADDTHRKRTPSHLLRFTYIGPTEVVQPTAGPRVLMDAMYEQLVNESKQFDVLFIPGGWGTTPRVVPPALLAFLKTQAPGAQYILSVCTGSWLLAQAGLLYGKRATINKALFDVVASRTDASIQWVHHARWVVDGKYWTTSGVTAEGGQLRDEAEPVDCLLTCGAEQRAAGCAAPSWREFSSSNSTPDAVQPMHPEAQLKRRKALPSVLHPYAHPRFAAPAS